MDLVRAVYLVSRDFPKEESYGLTAQVRRSAVSIPSNIAEGAARSGKRQFLQFLGVAKGSLSELETQLLIACQLGYVPPKHEIFGKLEHLSSLLSGLHRSLHSKAAEA
jgi:four helix bundle protein